MNDTRACSLIERLENRSLASREVTLVWEGQTPQALFINNAIGLQLQATEAVLNKNGTLFIRGTAADDSIRLHKTRSTLQISITTNDVNDAFGGSSIVNALRMGKNKNEQDLPAVITGADGELTYTYSVSTSQIKRIAVDGDAGHDVLKIDAAVGGAATTGIERTLVQAPTAPAGATPSDPAVGTYNGSADDWQAKLAQQLTDAQHSDASLAFFGDSHAERYPYYGRRSWNENFADALDLGTSGDSTRQLLARIEAGLFDSYKPDTLVLMVGTNNFNDPATSGTDAQIEAGIRLVVSALQTKLPDTKVVIVSILPRAEPGMNTRIEDVNAMTAQLNGQPNLYFLDVYDHFIGDPVRSNLYNGDNHLNAAGYRLLTTYLSALLNAI